MGNMELQRNMMKRLIRQVVQSSLIYGMILAVVLLVGYLAGHSVVWQGTEPSYPFFHWVSLHAVGTGVCLFFIGEILILLAYLWRICGYIQSILKSMRRVYEDGGSAEKNLAGPEENHQEDWIMLPEELKEAEQQMNLLHQQVQKSRTQAREAEQRKNDLVVYLAHDLKTPLTSVLGYLALLEEALDLPKEQREKYVTIARKKAERLEELINEFFEITRFNLTSMELERQRINFTRLLEQTVYEFQPMLREKQLGCRLEAEPDVMFSCDLDKMQRVVDNLLRNAILYGYGGTELLITLKVVKQEEDCLELTVQNAGPTIPAGKLERIFQQFYRLDVARTSSTGGAGLGLAIAREIVQLHGGSITAESQNEVTIFRVRLPINS